ncbi:hypothetical protein C0995_007629 [Termitomyces sp. Mi166|nr:hypothetical protein C0995_007629 [Termitomyces sp. Mi166\
METCAALNILPPPSATVVTFTAPLTSTPTYSSTVPVPPKSSSSGVVVAGPPGDHSRCSPTTNIWTLLFGGIINGCLPLDVGIRGGITPSPIQPPGWTGPWTDPFPLPTVGPPPGSEPEEPSSSQSSTTTSTSTSTSSTSCPTLSPTYNLPDDPENADTDTLGTDPDQRRKREEHLAHIPSAPDNLKLQPNVSKHTIHRRANPRTASIPDCGLTLTSSEVVFLGAGTYYYVPFNQNGQTGTILQNINVGGKPSGPPNFLETNQEHVFEIGYINQFFTFLAVATGCDWIERDVIDYTRVQGANPRNLGTALIDSIDNVGNMVWVDKPMNQAKSNVVNNNRQNPDNPPQHESMIDLFDFNVQFEDIIEVETFTRNFAALGQYFDQTSGIFSNTALNFMTLLSERLVV